MHELSLFTGVKNLSGEVRIMYVFSFPILKSEKQITLEKQGCVFQGQEWLDNHEIDPKKECYCKRPNCILGEYMGFS